MAGRRTLAARNDSLLKYTPSRDWREMGHHRGARRRTGRSPGQPIDWTGSSSKKGETPMDAHRQLLNSSIPTSQRHRGEERRQMDGVEMIPSENYTYPEVLAALGSVLTNKYSEGYPGRRYYGGQEFTDRIENVGARSRLRALPRRARQCAAPVRLADEPGGLFRVSQARRHRAGDGPFAWRASDSRRARLAHGQGVQLRALQERAPPGRRDRFRRPDRGSPKKRGPRLVLCGYSSYPRDYDYAAFKRWPTKWAR